MLHGNSVKLLTGMFPFYPIVSILTPWQGNSQHIGDELGGDGRAALVFFVHACVGVARDDGGNAAGGSALACGYEDKQLHQVVVDVATGRLEDEDVLVANRL